MLIKNKNIIKKLLIIILIIFIIFLFIKNIHLNSKSKNLFIDSNSIISLIDNNKTSIIYDYLKSRDKAYVLYNFNNDLENNEYISKYFPSIKYINNFYFMIYSILYKEKIMFYSSDTNFINKLKSQNISHARIVLNIDDISKEEYINLKDNQNTRIILSFTNNEVKYIDTNNILEKYLAQLDKNLIKVIDGDTIKYKENTYRFIGLDAPELKQNYGTNAKNYVINKINNAGNIKILISSIDVFDRILCYIFIDDNLLAYQMMKDKQAKETIMKYGDNGFESIASNIVYLSKHQGRRPFTDPAKFRKEN